MYSSQQGHSDLGLQVAGKPKLASTSLAAAGLNTAASAAPSPLTPGLQFAQKAKAGKTNGRWGRPPYRDVHCKKSLPLEVLSAKPWNWVTARI